MPSRPTALRAAALVAVALGCLLAAVPASAQYFGRNKIQYENFQWKVLSTPHFELFFYEGEEDLAARAAVIAEDAYARLSRTFDHQLSSRIPFVLYASPNDFQQTNIADGLIGEGTGGFSEPIRNRMVLPYPGDNEGFVHVIRHELVHVFMFDIVYHSTRDGAARRALFPVPLWFAEGAAEWFSVGWDQQAEMWMRDATIHDWLVPLPRLYGGFQVYKEGQSAMRYMAKTYGDPKVVEFFKAMGRTRNIDSALREVVGLSEEEFSERWTKALKHEYWPLYRDRQEPTELGRRLTDHTETGNYFFQQPALSPDGRWIAFFSDFEGLVDLFVMDAIEGTVARKLVTGYRSNQFLSLHSFESAIGFSPDSERLAFVAKSGRDEVLYIVEVPGGDVVREIPLQMDIARSPSWSPDGERIVLSGTRGGQTDLYLVSPSSGAIERISDDVDDEQRPVFSHDGRQVLYSGSSSPTTGVGFARGDDGGLQLDAAALARDGAVRRALDGMDIRALDLGTGEVETLVATPGDDDSPVVLGDSLLVFVSDAGGTRNLYSLERRSGELRRHSDVLGGVFHPTVSAATGKLAFSAFDRAGWDIFLNDNLDGLLQQSRFELPAAIGSRELARLEDPVGFGEEAGEDSLEAVPVAPGLAGIAAIEDALAEGEADDDGRVTLDNLDEVVARDKGSGRAVGEVEDYSLRWSLDPVGGGYGGVYYTQGVGLGLANVLSASDLLGNHRMQLLLNFYGSIEFSDLAFSYYYLKRRVNLAGGVFHYRNFINSSFTSLGEVVEGNQLFSERNYGVFGLASYPFTQFDRMDLELQAFVSDKTFFEYDDASGFFFESGSQDDRIIRPSLSLVRDSAFYGSFGPITGSRYLLSVSKGLAISDEDVDRTTTFVDLRRYFRLWDRNSLAFRMVGALSDGRDPRTFVIGGPSTLRGWDIFDFEREFLGDDSERYQNLSGRKMLLANVEYRFPFVDALFLGWPGRFGFGPIGGTVFFDAGSAFDGEPRFFGETPSGSFRLGALKADYGFGIRANLGFLPMRLDWAWKTDFAETSDGVQFNFSIGPEF